VKILLWCGVGFLVLLFFSQTLILCPPSSSIIKANQVAYVARGRAVRARIEDLNAEREPLGESLVWPKTSEFANSTEYLQKLDRMEGGSLSGQASVAPVDAEHNMWSIAANLTADAPEVIPILVTRNVDCTSLYRDLSTLDPHDKIQFSNKWKTPFGNKSFVMIRKGGSVFSSTGKYMTAPIMYGNQTFQTSKPGGGEGLVYLTPDGVAVPKSK
jgi:hypothetical protein